MLAMLCRTRNSTVHFGISLTRLAIGARLRCGRFMTGKVCANARQVKDETLAHLDKYLELFTENAARAGATIHWALDGKEACEIVLNLIKEINATNVVKAKSMATEEIHSTISSKPSESTI